MTAFELGLWIGFAIAFGGALWVLYLIWRDG